MSAVSRPVSRARIVTSRPRASSTTCTTAI
jgi:hypothetical protein